MSISSGFKKIGNIIFQIISVLVTLLVVAITRALLQNGYIAEAYGFGTGIVVLYALIWLFRILWAKRKENSKITDKSPKLINANVIVIFLLIIIALGIFYWFQLRPASIRSECNQWIIDQPGEVNLRTDSGRKKYEAQYSFCLHDKGLN